MQRRSNSGGIAITLTFLSLGLWTDATPLLAQNPDPWLNAPQPPTGRQVVPFFEGWYDNGDGTYTISFGYLNRNLEHHVRDPTRRA